MNRDALRTRWCCPSDSINSVFPSKIISDLSFTGVNLCCLGHETVFLNTMGNDKTQHPDLLAWGGEGVQKDPKGIQAGVTNPLSTSPEGYAVDGHLSG